MPTDEKDEPDRDGTGGSESSASGETDGIYAPGTRKLIREAQEALDDGDEALARERLSQAHGSLVHSRADDLDMSGPLKEALEAAVERDDFAEEIPLGSEETPDEWTVEGVEFGTIAPRIEREVRDIDDDTFLRITAEPSNRRGQYQIRFEVLPFEPKD